AEDVEAQPHLRRVAGVGILAQVALEVLLGLLELLRLLVRDRDVEEERGEGLLVVGLQELRRRGVVLPTHEEGLRRLEVVLGVAERLVGRPLVRRSRRRRADPERNGGCEQRRRAPGTHSYHRTTIRGQKASAIKRRAPPGGQKSNRSVPGAPPASPASA